MPLDPYFGRDKMRLYYPGLVQTVTYKGKLYALPRAYSTQALIYRTDLMKNPPKEAFAMYNVGTASTEGARGGSEGRWVQS